MAVKDPDNNQPGPDETNVDPAQSGWNKRTEFGEPLWMDVLKTLGVGLIMLSVTIIVGGALGVAIMAPWGRASHDCSIYCVLRKEFKSYFPDKPAGSGMRPINRTIADRPGFEQRRRQTAGRPCTRCVFPEGCSHSPLEIVHSVRAGEADVAQRQ